MQRVFAWPLAFAGLLTFSQSLLLAQAPPTINFQGRLTNAAGVPLPDGPRTVTFGLYDNPQGVFPVTGENLIIDVTVMNRLAHRPVVVNSETVQKADGSVTYTRGVDYQVDYQNGAISVLDAKALQQGTAVKVSYQYTAARLWQEIKDVTVKSGTFSTALGDTTPFPASLIFGQPLFLGIQVGTDPEMVPRQPLSSVPRLALPYADSSNVVAGSVFSVTNSGAAQAISGLVGPPDTVDQTPCGVLGQAKDEIGVLGISTANLGVYGKSISGNGVNGSSTSGAGVAGTSANSVGVAGQGEFGVVGTSTSGTKFGVYGTHLFGGASVGAMSVPGGGVGVFTGNLPYIGFAGFETNYSAGTTHIWCAENGNSVFSVGPGGAVLAASYSQSSDVRLKRDVETLQDPLDSVLRLRGVSFEWDPASANRTFPAGKQIGFIAQEVEKVLPEVVSTDEHGYKSVAYQNIVPVLVEAVKVQQTEIETLRAEVERLKRR